MLTSQEMILLGAIAGATAAGPEAFAYATQEEIANLYAQGFVLSNPAIVEPGSNRVAVRATPQGIEANSQFAAQAAAGTSWTAGAAAPGVATPPAPSAVTPASFVVQKGGALPKTKRGAPRTARVGQHVYPFDQLVDVGDYFFVPATAERKKPAKGLQSTIASANKRYADFQPPRRFVVRPMQGGQTAGEFVAPADGAFVLRVDPATAPHFPRKKKAAAAETPLPPSTPPAA